MIVAVLPLNAGPNSRPAIARQLSNFACEIVRNNTGADVNAVNYLVQVEEQPRPRFANVNASEGLNEFQMLQQLFEQSGAGKAMDGLFVEDNGSYVVDIRYFENGNEEPVLNEKLEFNDGSCFPAIRRIVELLAQQAGKELPGELSNDENLFGTANGQAFMKFLESYDALQYIEKTQGQVAKEFLPKLAMDSLIDAAKLDPDWEAPYLTLVQLTRACSQFQIGDPLDIESALKSLIETAPEDARGHFALGELYQAMGNLQWAADSFEKAQQLESDEPAILTRLGIVQMQMNMPVNAERNFRKALEMEGDDKPSMDFLAQVLEQQGRGHEIAPMWKEIVDNSPQNGQAHVKYAAALINHDNRDEGKKVFENAISTLEENVLAKRYFAPILAQDGDMDRAMDYYEDSLDVAPNDVQLLLEYAQTLQAAGREFEVPKVLQDVLNSNPDPNTRAQTMAWKLELEQPKRVETIANAQKQMEEGDFEGAIRSLKPMRNWLSDYWKLWALLAAAENRAGDHEAAEQTATQLINLFPACEPAYAELATALSAQNKHEEAYNAMRFAASQIQGSLPVAVNLALAANRAGHGDEAKQLAKQIREAVGNDNQELEQILAEIDRG